MAWTKWRSAARGAKLNRFVSHPAASPAARPKAIAVSTYGATTTVRPSASAGRICQRSRNARSAAYSSSSVRADGAPASSSATARSWKMPDASQRLMPPRAPGAPGVDAASAAFAAARTADASTPSTAMSLGRAVLARLTAALRRAPAIRRPRPRSSATTAAAGPRETARGSAGAARQSTARHRR